jgi:hypothetical protein
MRFCPFCSAENPSEASHCATCARRLPPLPPKRQRTQPVPVTAAPVDAGAVVEARPTTVPGLPPGPAPLMPSPAALRRQVPSEPRPDGVPARRRGDHSGAVQAPNPTPAPEPAAATPLSAPEPAAAPLPPPPVAASLPAIPRPPVVPDVAPAPAPARDASVEPTTVDPPPTRIVRAGELVERPFVPPRVLPIPEVPEPGLVNAIRYAVTFVRARWQRRGAIKHLGEEIKQDTASLDLVLGTLGAQARQLGIESRAIASENAAITAAEERKTKLEQANAELSSRKTDETSKFAEIERDRSAKVSDAEKIVEESSRELSSYEGQRRSLRDKRKEVERRHKAYLKAAEDRDAEAGNAAMGDTRSELRRLAEGHRREAASLEPDRQDLDRRLAALERPLAQAQAKVEAARGELESARRSLHDAREGHRHRLAEIEAEQGRKNREIAQADAEIHRRLVTLGTLINLNRIDHPGFAELYERIDRLRGAIGARTTEIDKLTAERDAYDRGSLVRGFATLGGGVVVAITLIVILLALF